VHDFEALIAECSRQPLGEQHVAVDDQEPADRRYCRVHRVSSDINFTFEIASKQIVPPSRMADAIARIDLGGAASAVVLLGAVAELGAHASAIRRAATAFASSVNAALCRIPQGANAVARSARPSTR
jgi:NADH-quinone oxidoreductase subunit G